MAVVARKPVEETVIADGSDPVSYELRPDEGRSFDGDTSVTVRLSEGASANVMVNGTDYGLANSVWSSDLNRCGRVAEQMCAGNSWINAHNVFPHGVPYGGIGKSGLGGGVNSPETLFDYWRSVSVVRPL